MSARGGGGQTAVGERTKEVEWRNLSPGRDLAAATVQIKKSGQGRNSNKEQRERRFPGSKKNQHPARLSGEGMKVSVPRPRDYR